MIYRVFLFPKEGILDPQSRAVKEMLEENGVYAKDIKIGKVIDINIEDSQNIDDIVKNYLLNPLIEDYKVQKL